MRLKIFLTLIISLVVGGGYAPAQTTPNRPAAPAVQPAAPASNQNAPAEPSLLQRFMDAFGLNRTNQQLTPQELERVYHDTWARIGATYHNPGALQDWGRWENKYKGKLNTVSDLENALKELTASLGDRSTCFLNAQQAANAGKLAPGTAALGLALERQSDGSFRIDYLTYGTPAYNSDLRRGDIVRSIGGTQIGGLKQAEVEALLVGKVGSKVEIVFDYDKSKGNKLTLSIVPSQSRVMVRLLSSRIGYVRMPELESEKSYADMMEALVKLQSANNGRLGGLVLDLRGNPSGQFGVALDVASVYMDKGTMAVATTRDGRRVTRQSHEVIPPLRHDLQGAPGLARFLQSLYQVPLVVITDENTGGAAEVLAGALKDNKRAIVIGATTCGKGVGYTVEKVAGGRLQITAVKYATPSGLDVSSKGVTPNIPVAHARGSRRDEALVVAVEALQQLTMQNPSTPFGRQADAGNEQSGESPLLVAFVVAALLLGITLWAVHYRLRKLRDEAERRNNRQSDN